MKGQPMPRVRLGGQIKGSTDKPIVTGLSTKNNTLLTIDAIPDQSLLMRSGNKIVGAGASAASLPACHGLR